ncbi:MAG: Mannose-phosphate guanylyltransferase [Phycisphaerales bacterium]|jgi:mannose-1-phosphate guanylyltransferase|nr:Mannose-phosphate guanylyltransferase [Phycisphaerales bacterium]MDB5304421.1 Mannose-phosphate guanylyltransferase [Phycisphaerales bacterium]
MQYGVIMAGGAGTRLWPLSRGNRPKQLLPVVQGKSLLRLSYDRLRGILPPERIFVCTGSAFGPQVLENLPELPKENLLGEPTGRDTANAVGFSAAVLHHRDKDAVAAIVTADHVIEPVENFQAAVRTAFEVAEEQPDALVTFGILPSHGHTGLGYVHRGEPLRLKRDSGTAYRVLGFKEKPDKPTADRYVESGRYYWNSGMFVWRCDTVLKELATHLPLSHRGLTRIAEAWDTPRRDAVLQEVYPALPKISIDYAVLEPASQGKGKAQVAVVEMPVQWLDVGSWPALAETLRTDDHSNAVECNTCVFVDSDDNIIVSEDPEHLISTIGINDMIIVHTRDATLVCPKGEAQRVKDLVGKVKEKFGNRYQ